MTPYDTATTRREKPPAHSALLRFLEGFSTEVTSRDRKSLDAAGDLLPPGTEVFVAFLARDTAAVQAAAAAQLRRAGLTPVPHIVARNLDDMADLDETLRRFAGEAGVDRALVLGGDRDKPRGAFESSLELIETGLLQRHGIRHISISCYPEGHPCIQEAVLDKARADKLLAATQAGLDVALVSQFCFDAAPILAFAQRLRTQGVTAPFRVGVAAPADHATLVKYALICGVGPSMRALKERKSLAKNLLAGETPEALLSELAAAQAANPALGLGGAHFFTFAALENLTRWMQELR